MAANLLVTAFDHELYRFLGLRLGPNFLDVYADPTTLADSLFLNILLADRGGPFAVADPVRRRARPLPVVGDPAGPAADRRKPSRRRRRASGRGRRSRMLVLPLATGAVGYSLAKAKFRLSRLEPALFAVGPRFLLEL